MKPEGDDECMKEISDGVLRSEVECVAARDERCGRDWKEGDTGV